MLLGFGPHSWDLGLKAGIWASRLGFGPRGWDLGLEARIWASMLEYGLQGGGTLEMKKEKFPLCVKA